MQAIQKIANLSPGSSIISSIAEMSVDNPEEMILSRFKVKPAGTRITRNTLVEIDSLSSYSLPEETSRQTAAGAGMQSGKFTFDVYTNSNKYLL